MSFGEVRSVSKGRDIAGTFGIFSTVCRTIGEPTASPSVNVCLMGPQLSDWPPTDLWSSFCPMENTLKWPSNVTSIELQENY